MKTNLKHIGILFLLIIGIPGIALAVQPIQQFGLNQYVEVRLEPANVEELERYGLDPTQRIGLCSFPVVPGERYTLEIHYPADEYGFRYTVFRTDPLSSSPKWAIATTGQGRNDPIKPDLITKLRLTIDPSSVGDTLYLLLARPTGTYRVALKSPPDPGVEEAAVMPGWEELGNLYYYHDHEEPVFLETFSPPVGFTAEIPSSTHQDQLVPPSSGQPKPESAYVHQPGEFAVILDWDGDFDLDLEIWSEEFEYIGDAFVLGESPDIYHGDHGAEWFVFRKTSSTGVLMDDQEIDFGQGRFIVSPYYVSPESDTGVAATLTVYLPNGEEMIVQRELFYEPPYDQWFAVLIDLDQERVEELDFFGD